MSDLAQFVAHTIRDKAVLDLLEENKRLVAFRDSHTISFGLIDRESGVVLQERFDAGYNTPLEEVLPKYHRYYWNGQVLQGSSTPMILGMTDNCNLTVVKFFSVDVDVVGD